METTEICPLTREAVTKLFADRHAQADEKVERQRRKAPRWPFPGTAELWVPGEGDIEHYTLATSLNLSLDGAGIRCDEPLPLNLELAVAFHEPEVSFHGRAVVRHCTRMGDEYLIGLQFLFDAA